MRYAGQKEEPRPSRIAALFASCRERWRLGRLSCGLVREPLRSSWRMRNPASGSCFLLMRPV
ncbi:hypothetical protein SEA_BIG4_355 [Microbacterium phage Big4]|nr:hypothetical protein SEA_BIG4_355 [Microbacterium phage Big4]